MFIYYKSNKNKSNFIFNCFVSSKKDNIIIKKKEEISFSQLSLSKVKCEISSNLFPYDDIITKEIDSWKSYSECLRKQDRELFYKMLNSCYKYSSSINVKEREYSTTSILMTILLEHHKNLLLSKKIENDIIIKCRGE